MADENEGAVQAPEEEGKEEEKTEEKTGE